MHAEDLNHLIPDDCGMSSGFYVDYQELVTAYIPGHKSRGVLMRWVWPLLSTILNSTFKGLRWFDQVHPDIVPCTKLTILCDTAQSWRKVPDFSANAGCVLLTRTWRYSFLFSLDAEAWNFCHDIRSCNVNLLALTVLQGCGCSQQTHIILCS